MNWGEPDNPFPLFLRLIIAPLVIAAYLMVLARDQGIWFFPKIKALRRAKSMLLEGVLLMTFVFAQDLLSSLDRLFVSGFYDQLDFGLYSFAFTLSAPVMLILRSIMFMDYSRLLNRYKDIDQETFVSDRVLFLKKYGSIYLVLFLIGSVGAYLLLHFFLEEYRESYLYFVLMLVLTVPNLFSFQYSIFLVANNESRFLTKAVLLVLSVACVLNSLIISFDLQIHWLIIASIVSKFLLLLLYRNKFKKSIK